MLIEIGVGTCPKCGYDLDRYTKYLRCCACEAKLQLMAECPCGCETQIYKMGKKHYIKSITTDGLEVIRTVDGVWINGRYGLAPGAVTLYIIKKMKL